MPTTHTVDPLALESQVCFALSRASRVVITAYRPVLEPLGLTHPQYLVMLALWQHEPLSLKDLSALLSLEPATLSPLVKRLEAINYVERTRNPHDDRALLIRLTATGRELRTQAEQVPIQMMQRLGLDEAELRSLHSAMTRLTTAALDAP